MRARGTLRWGGDMQGGEPYVFQDPGSPSGLSGFEVEIAGALARRLGLAAEFVQNDWQTLIPSLERGDFDVALNGIEVTPARRARVAFTRPYYVFTETLVVRRDDRSVHGLGDLRGARVGTLEGSLALDLVRAAPPRRRWMPPRPPGRSPTSRSSSTARGSRSSSRCSRWRSRSPAGSC